MDARGPLRTAEPRLPRPLAAAYLATVALVWLGHAAGLVLLLATGRSSWTTDNPWLVVPGFVVIASAVGTVWCVDRMLHRGRPPMTQAFRMLGLAYGSAVPTAWRLLVG